MTSNPSRPRQVFLAVQALVWLPYGIFCLASPGALGQITGFALTTATAQTEVRAMYGGLQMALGLLALLALRRESLARSLVLVLGVATAALAFGRLTGVVLDGGLSGYTIGGLGFEIGTAAWAAWLVRRESLVG